MPSRTRDGPSAARYPFDETRVRVTIAAALIVLVMAAALVLLVARPTGTRHSSPAAVIVDQLAATDPDPSFVKEATSELRNAGYRVDYVPPGAVTVDFYRQLPSKGYAVVLLRTHASDFVGGAPSANSTVSGHYATALFTNEAYDTSKHVQEQRQRRLLIENYVDRPNSKQYFGVGADFIALDTEGRFHGATIILMGCAGLKTDDLARAFVYKGASHFVSWNASVTAAHTDRAAGALLSAWLGQHEDLTAAIQTAMAIVGPDPQFHSRLVEYPD